MDYMKVLLALLLTTSASGAIAEQIQACNDGETVVLHCVNHKAGWGLDDLIINVCKNKITDEYSLVVQHIDPSKYLQRTPAIDNSEDPKLFVLESYAYTLSQTFSYSAKTNKAQYTRDESGNQLNATVDCK